MAKNGAQKTHTRMHAHAHTHTHTHTHTESTDLEQGCQECTMGKNDLFHKWCCEPLHI